MSNHRHISWISRPQPEFGSLPTARSPAKQTNRCRLLLRLLQFQPAESIELAPGPCYPLAENASIYGVKKKQEWTCDANLFDQACDANFFLNFVCCNLLWLGTVSWKRFFFLPHILRMKWWALPGSKWERSQPPAPSPLPAKPWPPVALLGAFGFFCLFGAWPALNSSEFEKFEQLKQTWASFFRTVFCKHIFLTSESFLTSFAKSVWTTISHMLQQMTSASVLRPSHPSRPSNMWVTRARWRSTAASWVWILR